MPFRFKRKESVRKAVRRMCCERLTDAIEPLHRSARFEAVHDVRKEIKKLRAVLRLVRAGIGKDAYNGHTNALRDAADGLTALRDAEVKLGAFDDLARHFKGKRNGRSFLKIKTALRKNCRAEESRVFKGGSIASVKGILYREKQQFDHLKINANGWSAIGPGLKKIYSRGREAFEAAERDPSPKNFHEWRKRVKDLGHQLRLLCPAHPRKFRARTNDLDKLGELLGDEHDLFMLKQFVANKFGHAPGTSVFRKLISARQEELCYTALKLGRRFYPKKPGRFARSIGRDWKKWRRS
jgi:CHAD domain-containing protein